MPVGATHHDSVPTQASQHDGVGMAEAIVGPGGDPGLARFDRIQEFRRSRVPRTMMRDDQDLRAQERAPGAQAAFAGAFQIAGNQGGAARPRRVNDDGTIVRRQIVVVAVRVKDAQRDVPESGHVSGTDQHAGTTSDPRPVGESSIHLVPDSGLGNPHLLCR